MALRALLFSKNPETADALAAPLNAAGIRAELCTDIFAAMEKGTKQPFSCVMVDWSEQPEAGFLLKRARESGLNRTALAIAIVDGDPTADEERENRLDFLIYRPITPDEASAVLAKARQQMQLHSPVLDPEGTTVVDRPEMGDPSEPPAEDPNLVSIAGELPESIPQAESLDESEAGTPVGPRRGRSQSSGPRFQTVLAAALMLTAAFCFWKSRDSFQYLSQTPEGAVHVLQESVAAIFYVSKQGTQSVGTAMTDSQQDAYFTRTPANAKSQPVLGVVSAEIKIPDGLMHLRPAFDFPLPTPELLVDVPPTRPQRAAVPDSIKASAPVTRPVVMTVSPAQMLPVSTPPPPTSWQNTGEPVHLTEEFARALVTQLVEPVYPPEAMTQKLQGPVVLQVAVGRDGSVQDLKLVRGYFVLGRAAIAAVKQWRFKPYSVNGKALETQTQITINFTYPPG